MSLSDDDLVAVLMMRKDAAEKLKSRARKGMEAGRDGRSEADEMESKKKKTDEGEPCAARSQAIGRSVGPGRALSRQRGVLRHRRARYAHSALQWPRRGTVAATSLAGIVQRGSANRVFPCTCMHPPCACSLSCVRGAPGMRHIHTHTHTKKGQKEKRPPPPKKNRRASKRTVQRDADRKGSRTIGEADR